MKDSYYGFEIISQQPNENIANLESLQKHLYSLITRTSVQDVKLELPDEKTEQKILKFSGTDQNWEIKLSSITYKEILKLVIFQFENQSKALFVPADESRPKVNENFAFPPPIFTRQGTPFLVLITGNGNKDEATGMLVRKCHLLALNTIDIQKALHMTAIMDV